MLLDLLHIFVLEAKAKNANSSTLEESFRQCILVVIVAELDQAVDTTDLGPFFNTEYRVEFFSRQMIENAPATMRIIT